VRRIASANATSILAERHVANPMQAVFNALVSTPPSQQFDGSGLNAWDAGDGIGHLGLLDREPAGNGLVTASPTQNSADHGGQHGRQREASSLAPARIGNLLRHFQQIPRASGLHEKTSLQKRNPKCVAKSSYAATTRQAT
jgi:hypothetical protein